MGKRYAEGTTVQVQTSRGEITGILAKHGCQTMAWGSKPTGDTLMFDLDGKQFRFFIPKPELEKVKSDYWEDHAWSGRQIDWTDKVEAEWRRRWRAHVLLIKAKLEFIEGGDTTLEREFLPYLVLQDGRTMGQFIDQGGVPLLMSGSSDGSA